MTTIETTHNSQVKGYDVIGDVHGQADKLIELLTRMGYGETDAGWRSETRTAVFVGDLIDNGPAQRATLNIARQMADSGAGIVVAGNHEFNAVAFHTPDDQFEGEYLRKRNDKHRDQHSAFLDEVGEDTPEHAELVQWFLTLPLWFEADGLRVVHACWDPASIEIIQPQLTATNSLTLDLVAAASRKGTPEHGAIEHILKGPEIEVPHTFLDKKGYRRDHARFRWWDAAATHLDAAVVIPGGTTTPDGGDYPQLDHSRLSSPPVPAYSDDVPVIYGHYWETGKPTMSSPRTACVDYSAGKGGPLVAYRWSGESVLSEDNFASSS